MSDKDIRDIAGYWGAQCSYERRAVLEKPKPVFVDNVWNFLSIGKHGKKKKEKGILYADILSRIHKNNIQCLTLHLRPIASLTNEEWNKCFKSAYPAYSCKTIERIGEDYYLSDGDSLNLCIHCGPHYAGFNVRAYLHHDEAAGFEAADLVNYLQSISVYVPGTINEKYVELL